MVPLVDRGVVLPQTAAGDGFARWQIEFGGHNRLRLRVARADDLAAQRKSTTVRQTTTYDFAPGGVNVSVQLSLDATASPPRQLILDLDPDLRITSARCGDAAVPWSVAATSAGLTRGRRPPSAWSWNCRSRPAGLRGPCG